MTPTAKSNGNGAPDRADPVALTPHERLRELTAILASGIHRLRATSAVPVGNREIPAESSRTGLDLGARACPDGAVLTLRENGDR